MSGDLFILKFTVTDYVDLRDNVSKLNVHITTGRKVPDQVCREAGLALGSFKRDTSAECGLWYPMKAADLAQSLRNMADWLDEQVRKP